MQIKLLSLISSLPFFLSLGGDPKHLPDIQEAIEMKENRVSS